MAPLRQLGAHRTPTRSVVGAAVGSMAVYQRGCVVRRRGPSCGRRVWSRALGSGRGDAPLDRSEFGQSRRRCCSRSCLRRSARDGAGRGSGGRSAVSPKRRHGHVPELGEFAASESRSPLGRLLGGSLRLRRFARASRSACRGRPAHGVAIGPRLAQRLLRIAAAATSSALSARRPPSPGPTRRRRRVPGPARAARPAGLARPVGAHAVGVGAPLARATALAGNRHERRA